MTIRALTPAELEAHCRVSSMAFHWKCKLEEEKFPEGETLLGCFDDEGVMTAELEYRVRDASWGDGTVPLVCVGGVASLPHCRHGGAVRRLFDELEALAEREGWVLGALGPFTDAYYRKFGYERMSRVMTMEAPMDLIREFARTVPFDQRGKLELMEGEVLPEDLLRVYNAYAAKVPLMLRRGQEHARWFHTKPLEECDYCMLWRSAAGVPEGYVQYNLTRENSTLNVQELAFLTPEALRGLLCFLQGYASKAERVVFCALPWGNPLPLLLCEHTKTKITSNTGMSVRIYDAEQALQRFGYADDCGFVLEIQGDSIARNNAVFHVQSRDGKARVECTSKTPDVTVTREALALLFSGQVGDMMALQCCPGVVIACEEQARHMLRAFRQDTIPMMWDGF